MQIEIFGCRGSLPKPGPATQRYGGNTTCLLVRSAANEVAIFDAGSGLHELGKRLLAGRDPKQLRFFFTHGHWDHLLGFPFFRPAYRKDYTLTFCSGPHQQGTIRGYLAHQMQAPFFPVEIDALAAGMAFHCDNPDQEERPCRCGGLRIKAFPASHPNGGFGYLIGEGGATCAFVPDNEPDFPHPESPGYAAFVELFRGLDLLIHDAQYSDDEYRHTRGWGHSTFTAATDLAIAAGVKRLVLFHHDPDRSDTDLDAQLALCRQRIRAAGSPLDCIAAEEGLVLTCPG